MSHEPPGPGRASGTLRPTSPAVLAAWSVVGLTIGWLLHPLSVRAGGTAPIISWSQPLTLVMVAVVIGVTAWSTWRSVRGRRDRLLPHQAVNRLVLARASAYVGALVGGGYLGYALSWIGVEAELGGQRAWRSALAAVAGLALVVTGLLLERACRVQSDDSET